MPATDVVNPDDPRTYLVNFQDLRALLDEAEKIIDLYDDKVVPADYVAGRTRSNAGLTSEVNRDLLRLKDLFGTCSSEVGMLYWAFKDFADPRFDQA